MVDSISPSRIRHALLWLWVVSGITSFVVLPIPALAVCEFTGDFVWSVGKKDAVDEHAVALDTNGGLYLDGVLWADQNVDSHLTSNAVSGTTIWKVTNSGGTKVAAIYQHNTTGKWNMVISGHYKHTSDFGAYSGVTAHWKINDSGGNPLLALKRAGSDLTDGSLLIKCATHENLIDQDWFFQENWLASGLGLPPAFTFIPGKGRGMFVSDRTNFKIRYVKDDGDHGTLVTGQAADLSAIMTTPSLQGTPSAGGLMGVACHPKFAEPTPRRYVYVYGTAKTPTPLPNDLWRNNEVAWVNRIYRFEVNADLTPIASPAPIPNDFYVSAGNATPTPPPPPLTSPFTERLDHYGGCLRSYSKDGKSYLLLSTGCIDHELDYGKMSQRPQDARSLVGKLLRFEIEDDGDLVIPSDNPFASWTPVQDNYPPASAPTPTQRYPAKEVIASGFRNPYTFALRPGPTPGVPIEAWVGNVGGLYLRGFEEVNKVSLSFAAGGNRNDHKNFGFPRIEGDSDGSTVWSQQGESDPLSYQYYIGCDGCAGLFGGDLDFDSTAWGDNWHGFPQVPNRTDLEPPSIYYHRFDNEGSVGGGAFISTSAFPSRYFGDFFFLDWIHGSLSRVPKATIDAGGSHRIQTIEDLMWWDTGDTHTNLDMLEGPDGALYYTRYRAGDGGIDRFRYVE